MLAVQAMAPITPQVCTKVDPKKKPWEQSPPLHNRWHPDIPPVRACMCALACSVG